MTDWRQETLSTYNRSAQALAEYFKGIGSRLTDIDRAIHLAGNPKNPSIVEIGCGDGRDAKELVKRASSYIGYDISEAMVELAKQYVPEGKFEVGDAISYHYPKDVDIIFAFASLLHLNKDEIKIAIDKVKDALRPGGIFYISLKFSETYKEEVKEDQHGRRMFYFYNPSLIEEVAGDAFETVHIDRDTKGTQPWFQMALRKK